MAKKAKKAKEQTQAEPASEPEETEPGEASAINPEPEPEAPPAEAESEPSPSPAIVVIELPLGVVGEEEYLSRHVECRLKTREQQMAMKRLLRGLQRAGAKTRDGRPVQRPGEAVRWLLEQISEPD